MPVYSKNFRRVGEVVATVNKQTDKQALVSWKKSVSVMKMGRGEPGVDSSDIVREEGSGKDPRAIWLEDSFLKFPILESIKKSNTHD